MQTELHKVSAGQSCVPLAPELLWREPMEHEGASSLHVGRRLASSEHLLAPPAKARVWLWQKALAVASTTTQPLSTDRRKGELEVQGRRQDSFEPLRWEPGNLESRKRINFVRAVELESESE